MPRRIDVLMRFLSVLLVLAGLVYIMHDSQPARGQLGAPGCGASIGKLIYQPCVPAAAAGCPQATAFLARTSGLDGTHTTAYTTMICGLVTDGVFAKLDTLYAFITADATTAKLNLVQNLYNSTAPNGEPTFVADAGYTGVSNKYLDSQFNASTAITPNYVQNSASMFVCSNTSTQDPGDVMGVVSGFQNGITTRNGVDQFKTVLNSGSFIMISNTDGSGLWGANRTSSSNVDVYHNGASFAAGNTNTSAAVQNSDMTFLVGSNFSTATLFFGGWGATLTGSDETNLSLRLKAFVLAVSGLTQCG